MKFLICASFLFMSVFCRADTFLLKDGSRIEGEVTGEMNGALLIRTSYGSLSINKSDVREQKAAPAAAAAHAAAEQEFTLKTVIEGASTRRLLYSKDGIVAATETFNSSGAQVSLKGAIPDGTYTERYPDGGLKTVKTMVSGKASGALKAYYANGAVQVEANYLSGAKDGPFKYYTENGKLLMEADYKNDKLNGWKKEYDADGAVKTESYYADDHLADPSRAAASSGPAKERESAVTARAISLARGERFSFQINGDYVGKANLDKDFNIISLEGKIPDGTVKVYSKDGKIQKEFVFERYAIKLLRVYQEGGPLKAEYTFKDNKAVKK